MKIALACDHGGYFLKEEIKNHLQKMGLDVVDYGTHGTDSVDYPDLALALAEGVVQDEGLRGILVCGTGIGISIAANKVPGIRAALCGDVFSAKMSREHNDANVLALGARVIGPGLALEIVDAWLGAEFAGGRHQNRVDKITAIERKYSR